MTAQTEAAKVYATLTVDSELAAMRRHQRRADFNRNAGETPNVGTQWLADNTGTGTEFPATYTDGRFYEFPTYGRLVWNETEQAIHVSYYRNEADCMRDRRTLSKRAVSVLVDTAYESYKNETKWRDFVAALRDEFLGNTVGYHFEISACETLEEIREVYSASLSNGGEGSTSCMNIAAKSSLEHTSESGKTVFPCDCYHNDTIRVMRVMLGGELVGRFIAPASADTFYTVYADSVKNYRLIKKHLKSLGWNCDSDFLRHKGCYLNLIKTDEGKLLMPYLDGSWDHMDGDTGEITYSDGYQCRHIDGTADGWQEYTHVCDDCGEGCDEDDLTATADGECVCGTCLRRNYSYAFTGRYREWVRDDETVGEYNGSLYTADGAEYHDLVVTCDGDLIDSSDAVEDEDGDIQDKANCILCPVSGAWVARFSRVNYVRDADTGTGLNMGRSNSAAILNRLQEAFEGMTFDSDPAQCADDLLAFFQMPHMVCRDSLIKMFAQHRRDIADQFGQQWFPLVA
jgi:hypothetical protein